MRLDAWCPSSILGAYGLCLVAPTREPTKAEEGLLGRFLAGGGRVLVATGGPGYATLEDVYPDREVKPLAIPLGTVPSEWMLDRDALLPRFPDAWPLAASADQETTVLAEYGGKKICVMTQTGEGRMVVLGSPRFFSTNNIAGFWGYWPGNVKFIYYMLGEWLGPSTSPKSPFAEPEAPPDPRVQAHAK